MLAHLDRRAVAMSPHAFSILLGHAFEWLWGSELCRELTRKILHCRLDDPQLRDALIEQLSLHEEFEAAAAENGSKGVQLAKEEGQIDLVIMDVGLPDIDGREAVRILRRNGFKAPIIMLTGHDTDSDTILGLESGANDYVTKPFRFAVLLARIRTQLRQHEASEDAIFAIGPYRFWPASKLLLNREGSKLPFDREGDLRSWPVPLSRRRKASIARETLARGVGLQLRSDHAHARDTHLSVKAENRKRCRCSGRPCYCRRRLQAGALIAIGQLKRLTLSRKP